MNDSIYCTIKMKWRTIRMKSNEKQQRRELLQEQLLKYENFGSDGKLHKVSVHWSARAYWSGEIEVDHLDITKEDIERGLTEDQCNSLWDAYTEEKNYSHLDTVLDI